MKVLSFQVSSLKIQASSFKPQASSFKFQASGFRFFIQEKRGSGQVEFEIKCLGTNFSCLQFRVQAVKHRLKAELQTFPFT